MVRESMEIIIYDTEFTTWEGTLEANWSRPGEAREIVQFSAMKLKLDEQVSLMEAFDVLVKPQKNPVLSDYFSDLTGITQQQVDASGISSAKMFDALLRYSDAGKIAMFSWGNDLPSIKDTADQCSHSVNWVRSYDLRDLFTAARYDVAGFNSGNLYKLFGLDLDIREHNAFDDVRSLVASVEHLFEKHPQVVTEFFNSIN